MMNIHNDLSGKIAVVTGGSRGIGRHTAEAFNNAGSSVVITAQQEDTLIATAQSLGDRCHPYICDHSSQESVNQLVEAVVRDVGIPDILVNNAAVFGGGKVIDMQLDVWNRVIGTNLTGVFLTTKGFLAHMLKKERGDIFMISSMNGKKGDPGSSAYSASKFGLQGFAQSLMYEVRSSNIRVTVLNPSSVDTGPDTGPRHGKGLYLHAADIAATIVHLARLPGRTMIRDLDIWGTNP